MRKAPAVTRHASGATSAAAAAGVVRHGKGWKTRKRQQRALEKLSIVLARENGAMIARATSWQQAVATRP